MFLTIQDSNNKSIMSAKLKHFSLHTSACESYINSTKYSNKPQIGKCNAVYSIHLDDIQIENNELLLEFEEIHRLDHTDAFSGNKLQDDRSYYVIIQPELRGKFSWNITDHGYRKKSL